MGNLTLTWVRERGVYPPLCWFFLDKSETVNAVTHHFSAFSNILKETFLINFASLTTPCVQILDKTQMEKFLISGFLVDLLLKKIVITPEPVMILIWDLDQKLTPKNIDNNFMSANCDVVVSFGIYDKFEKILKADFGREVCKTYVFINSNLLFYKIWKQKQKISGTAWDHAEISKIKRPWD